MQQIAQLVGRHASECGFMTEDGCPHGTSALVLASAIVAQSAAEVVDDKMDPPDSDDDRGVSGPTFGPTVMPEADRPAWIFRRFR